MLPGIGPVSGNLDYFNPYSQLRSDLSLDALMLKVILESPKHSLLKKRP